MSLLLLTSDDLSSPSAIANAYARMLTGLLPPGKLWRFVGSILQDLFLGCADELARVHARVGNLIDEADPTTAVELVPEYEAELDLDEAPTLGERRARIVARLVARQRFRPVDFQTALAPLLGQDPEDVVVIERSRAYAISVGDDREIYRFFIYRDPTLPGTYFLSSAQEIVDQIQPSHTVGLVIESVNFLCDDPFSLCDRDLLGV
jgi:uncharacterized protein YmfQ (DUF2313 family)